MKSLQKEPHFGGIQRLRRSQMMPFAPLQTLTASSFSVIQEGRSKVGLEPTWIVCSFSLSLLMFLFIGVIEIVQIVFRTIIQPNLH